MQLIHGDCLKVMQKFSGGVRFDGIITDPPYSSGALERAVATSTAAKYTSIKRGNRLPDFDGECMDTRVWMGFMTEVLSAARAVCKHGGVVCAFCDWRRLSAMADAFQRAGWRVMGVAVWDKTEGVRPQRGRFRQQAEFIVWGANGALSISRDVKILPGVFRHANVTAGKVHQVQKPLELMKDICRIVEPGGTILDMFCGSGTTLLAARELGLNAVGIESNSEICAMAARRLGTRITEEYEGGLTHDRFDSTDTGDYCCGGGADYVQAAAVAEGEAE